MEVPCETELKATAQLWYCYDVIVPNPGLLVPGRVLTEPSSARAVVCCPCCFCLAGTICIYCACATEICLVHRSRSRSVLYLYVTLQLMLH